ncbi:MAG: energy-coupling factor transporter transmembrane protein EcfT [Actinobacteria bacterium]|nr:energy-coupling factor transporter transmembrane protein EcfT [Actinomycetota bacterium]
MSARLLHAGAWWMWALGLAAAASRTSNPLILLVIIAITALIVAFRAQHAPWARAYSSALVLAAIVVSIRVIFGLLVGLPLGTHELFSLPQLPVPDWAPGIRIGGSITIEQLLSALFDGMRLGTIIVCIGAANALSSPLRLLKSVPSAVYELGVAIVVAMSLVPTLISDIARVREARHLRGRSISGPSDVIGLIGPVLDGSLRRSLDLAAAMDSRGYGRTAGIDRKIRRVTNLLVVTALVALVLGIYGFLTGNSTSWVAPTMLIVGLATGVGSLILSGQRTARSRYRPDVWAIPEWSVSISGWLAAGSLWWVLAHNASALEPSFNPLSWPPLPLLVVAGLAFATIAALMTPPIPSDQSMPMREESSVNA